MKIPLATMCVLWLAGSIASADTSPCPVTTKIMPDNSIVLTNCHGQTTVEPAPQTEDSTKAPAVSASNALPSSAAEKAQQTYTASYWKYNTDSLALRHKVFVQQYRISAAIFVLVVLLVALESTSPSSSLSAAKLQSTAQTSN